MTKRTSIFFSIALFVIVAFVFNIAFAQKVSADDGCYSAVRKSCTPSGDVTWFGGSEDCAENDCVSNHACLCHSASFPYGCVVWSAGCRGGGAPAPGVSCGSGNQINPQNVLDINNNDRYEFGYQVECGGATSACGCSWANVGPEGGIGDHWQSGDSWKSCVGANWATKDCTTKGGWKYSSTRNDNYHRIVIDKKYMNCNEKNGQNIGGWTGPCHDQCPNPHAKISSSVSNPSFKPSSETIDVTAGERILFVVYTDLAHDTEPGVLGANRRLHDTTGGVSARVVYREGVGAAEYGNNFLHDCKMTTGLSLLRKDTPYDILFDCAAPLTPGSYTATFTSQKNCDINFTYTVCAAPSANPITFNVNNAYWRNESQITVSGSFNGCIADRNMYVSSLPDKWPNAGGAVWQSLCSGKSCSKVWNTPTGADGVYNFTHWGYDNYGRGVCTTVANWTSSCSNTLKIDKTRPLPDPVYDGSINISTGNVCTNRSSIAVNGSFGDNKSGITNYWLHVASEPNAWPNGTTNPWRVLCSFTDHSSTGCAGTWTVPAGKDGTYHFWQAAFDGAGNYNCYAEANPTPSTNCNGKISIDRSLPVVASITTSPSCSIKQSSTGAVDILWNATDTGCGNLGIRYTVQIDSLPSFTTNNSQASISDLAYGSHTVKVTPKDAAGNVGLVKEASFSIAYCLDTYVITPSSVTKQAGQTQQFSGLYDPDGPSGSRAEQNQTNSATWSSSNINIATITGTGASRGLATCGSIGGTVTITSVYSGITANTSLTCAPSIYTLTVTKSGTGTGTVTSNPAGINCHPNANPDCSEPYSSGTSVTLTETPTTGSTFVRWTGACAGTATTCTVTMSQARAVDAEFSHNNNAPTANAGLDKQTKEGTAVSIGTATCGTDANGDTMTYLWSCTGGTLSSSTICQPNWTAPFINVDTNYTCTLTVTDEHGATGIDTMTATSQAYTLGVDLTANPSNGNAPLNGVDLTATVSGDAVGTIIYQFDCTNDGTYELTTPATNTNPYTAVDVCSYATQGTYTAKVRVQRGDASPAIDTTAITVTNAPTYILTVTKSGTGTGTVTSNPAGINCGSDCSESYSSGTSVTLTAAQATGSTFVRWTGACAGTATTCTVTMSQARAVDAEFSHNNNAPTANAGLDKQTKEGTAVSIGTATCGTDANGDTMTYLWSCTGGTLSSSTICQPNWTAPFINVDTNYTCTLTVTDEHGATGIDTMTATSQAYTLGVTLEAIPNSGPAPLNDVDLKATVTGDAVGTILYDFDCNNDGTYDPPQITSSVNPYTVVDKCDYPTAGNYTAKVRVQRGDASPAVSPPIPITVVPVYTLTVTKPGTGTGTVTSNPTGINCHPNANPDCSEPYSSGTSVTLTETPATGSTFTSWSANCAPVSGHPEQCTTTMTVAKTVTASFSHNLPTANNLIATSPNYCQTGTTEFLSWTFYDSGGDSQASYRIQVDNNSNFSSPEDDSGQVNSSSNSYAVPQGKLAYGQTYYWRLMVWDSGGSVSNWINGNNFSTPLHAYPSPNFTWTPVSLTKNQQASFIDQTSTYGGSTVTSWQWTFEDGIPSSSSVANPKSKFLTLGIKIVQLTATDSDGFSCAIQKPVPVTLHLPEWVEIAPTL